MCKIKKVELNNETNKIDFMENLSWSMIKNSPPVDTFHSLMGGEMYKEGKPYRFKLTAMLYEVTFNSGSIEIHNKTVNKTYLINFMSFPNYGKHLYYFRSFITLLFLFKTKKNGERFSIEAEHEGINFTVYFKIREEKGLN